MDGWIQEFSFGALASRYLEKNIYIHIYIYIIAAWGTIYPSYLNDDHTMIMSIHH